MNEVDAILSGHSAAITAAGPEAETATVERYPRTPHAAMVRELSRVNGWWTTWVIGLQWAAIIGCLVAAAWHPTWWVAVLGGCIIATRLQALGVLLHEATHYALYKNRVVNDVVADLFVAFPLGMSTTLYRKTHFRHHRYTNTSEDQDLAAQREEREWFEWPKSPRELIRSLIRATLGGNTHRAWVLYKYWAPWRSFFRPLDADFPLRARVLYVLSAIGVYGLIGWGFATNWKLTAMLCAMYAVPTMTLLNLINRIRATAEHIGVELTNELNSTRTVIPTWFERLTIAPFNVSYHLEHHLFPSVPAHNLGKLHRYLMEDEQFRDQAHITKSYVGFFRELMTLPPQRDESESAATTD